VDPLPVIEVRPPRITAAPGQQVRLEIEFAGDRSVTYQVGSDDADVAGWCYVLVPESGHGPSAGAPGELLIDVPAEARPARYRLRLVATRQGRSVAAADVILRVEGDRCLKIVALPKFELQADGTVVATLRVVNCGGLDVTLVVRARHESGWSFTVDDPELVIGVGEDPVTVKVTLRPPADATVERGDRITLEVETGGDWQPYPGRVLQPLRTPLIVAAVAVIVVAAAASGVSALLGEPDDGGVATGGLISTTTGTADTSTTGSPVTTGTPDPSDPGGPGDPGGPTTSGTLGQVPDVVSQTVAAATRTLIVAGYDVTTQAVDNPNVPEGIVVAQNPPAFTPAAEGTTVALDVSNGPGTITIPDVDGLPEAGAFNTLEEQGFNIATVLEEESNDVAVGNVIRSDPPGGSEVPADDVPAITLIVSTGPPGEP
jgi:hypothetical protein